MIGLLQEEKKERAVAPACIKVVGVGGAGGNTVNSIMQSGCKDVECIVINTDAQALELSPAHNVQIGASCTKGLGTGANPEIGKRAAEEDLEKIMDELDGADIVFLTAGMGGGTGSGAAPVIARALHDKGILSIALVTKPFLFEGNRRYSISQEAVEQLKNSVDTLLVMPNQKLLEITDKNVSMIEAFGLMNNVLSQSVRSISDIITKPGHINVDFADVRAIMKDRGVAVMGTGCASGDDRATEAALQAISSPLLENMNVTGARGILFNIRGGVNLGLHEISESASIIYQEAHPDANIILGSVIDESLTDEVVVTIIATGFDDPEKKQEIVTEQPQEQPSLSEDALFYASLTEQAVKAAQELAESVKANQVAVEKQQQEKQQQEKQQQEKEQQERDAAADQVILLSDMQAEQNKDLQEDALLKDIDIHDLDVPAFMRQEAQKTQD